MKRIAIIGAVLEKPVLCQQLFNDTVVPFRNIIKGRMGTPFNEGDVSVVSLVACGDLNEINALTGKLGNIPHVTVKTALPSVRDNLFG